MQRFLSYVVEAPDEVFIKEHFLALGPGTNAFSVTVEDPAAFRQLLLDAGCTITQENYLDGLEALPPEVVQVALPEASAAQQLAQQFARTLPRGGG